jgi:hypothetical protein
MAIDPADEVFNRKSGRSRVEQRLVTVAGGLFHSLMTSLIWTSMNFGKSSRLPV